MSETLNENVDTIFIDINIKTLIIPSCNLIKWFRNQNIFIYTINTHTHTHLYEPKNVVNVQLSRTVISLRMNILFYIGICLFLKFVRSFLIKYVLSMAV